MTRLIPQNNRRPGKASFVTERTEARRAQFEGPAVDRRLEPDPAGGQHPDEMTARKKQHVVLHRAHAAHHAVRARRHLRRRFAAGAAVPEQQPARTLRQDLRGAAPFIFPVVPLHQVGVDFRTIAEAGQFAGPDRALQGAGKHLGKRYLFQPFPEPSRRLLALFGQRQIGKSRVLARETPCRLTMSGQIDNRKFLTHDIALSARMPLADARPTHS